jgi:hypothetical protein
MDEDTRLEELIKIMFEIEKKRENSNEETKKNSKEMIRMYQEEEMCLNDLIFNRLKPVRYWEAANYILIQYSDEPHSNLIPDHCKEEALLMFATILCRSHIGKTQESLYKDLLKINDIYIQNPLNEHDVYEIAEKVFYKEQKIRQEVFTEDDVVNLFFNSKIEPLD